MNIRRIVVALTAVCAALVAALGTSRARSRRSRARSGGIFQMESETQVVVTHTLAAGVFYLTNPFTGRTNFGNRAALPPCTHQCQVQNQVRDTLPVPGP